jgi:signal transduction histidine kinase
MGLRARIIGGFSLAALAVTALLSTLTWTLASSYMLSQREKGAYRQASANAVAVQASALTERPAVNAVLDAIAGRPRSAAYVIRSGGPIASTGAVGLEQLPPGVLALAKDGTAARQRVELAGIPVLVIALPLAGKGTYVEVFPLQELDGILTFLSGTLIAATLLSVLLGAATGLWGSRRVLSPLVPLTRAAESVAAGDLTTRLDAADDPDLAGLGRSFNHMTASLQARIARDARFTSDVSHELRSPVMTMLNAMAVLTRREDDMTPEMRNAVDLLASDLERFARMVTDLLEISRVDHEQHRLPDEQVDLTSLVYHCVESVGGKPSTVQVSEGPIVVVGDRRRLERVLRNLLENATKHGGGLAAVRLSCTSGAARVEVDDSGPGVPVAERERIFDRFSRGALARSTDESGTGLGLAIATEHVRIHGGQIWVEDAVPAGARFVLELPCAA